MEWAFDDQSFLDAAQIVMVLNERMRSRHETPEKLALWLKVETQHACPRPGFWGTGDINISVTWANGREGDGLFARADPCGWLVLNALVNASHSKAKEAA